MIALFLFGGFALLLLGGELLVKGSVAIAAKLRVSKVIIGLTLVAFATSAPELLVSVIAAIRGKSDIALGNVIGSNIANVGLILGSTALLFKLQADLKTYVNDWLFLLIANTLLAAFLFLGGISTVQGGLLVLLLIGYNVIQIRKAKKNQAEYAESDDSLFEGDSSKSFFVSLLLVVLGALGLKFGAQLFVDGISAVALSFGWTERFVSVTMVAFGTSVPELAASITAARKGESDIAVGNIIGSNIFNIF